MLCDPAEQKHIRVKTVAIAILRKCDGDNAPTKYSMRGLYLLKRVERSTFIIIICMRVFISHFYMQPNISLLLFCLLLLEHN